MALGAVFDERQAVFGAQRRKRVQVAGLAIEMYGDDGPGLGADHACDALGVEGVGVFLHFGEHGGAPGGQHGVVAGQGGVRGQHDLASLAAQGAKGQEQGIGTAVHGHGDLAAQPCRKFFFESFDLWPHEKPAALEHTLKGLA